MTEVERIADQLRRAYEGEAWHGPPLKEILTGVTAEQAAHRVVPNGHTIWELVHHIGAWESIVRRRLGGEAVKATPEMDWPPVGDTSEAAWKNALDALERGNLQLRQAIADLSDDQLRQKVVGEKYSVYGMLHGVIQHDLYHAGQIAILKKAL
ncbi:MAG TPA: DinB family protein [Candidatus Acidoferrales bacterium]|nr:DinB family protein [Candidatus Acidoferrales bacterium]